MRLGEGEYYKSPTYQLFKQRWNNSTLRWPQGKVLTTGAGSEFIKNVHTEIVTYCHMSNDIRLKNSVAFNCVHMSIQLCREIWRFLAKQTTALARSSNHLMTKTVSRSKTYLLGFPINFKRFLQRSCKAIP